MIVDSFIFLNELDILEIRLRELDAVVDRWVVVESSVTRQGQPKASCFGNHRARFAPWSDRIISVIVEPEGQTSREREAAQRRAIRVGLEQAGVRRSDVVLLADADEIPAARGVGRFAPAQGAAGFEQDLAYYWLNCWMGKWTAGRIASWGFVLDRLGGDLHALRFLPVPMIQEGGWHFSYQGGWPMIQEKLAAFMHDELHTPRVRDVRHLRVSMACGLDLFDRPGHHLRFVPLDGRFPACVRDPCFRHLWVDVAFHERWMAPEQVRRLTQVYDRVRDLSGAVLEIGAWEGYSTVGLAQAAYPEEVLAVDTWQGSADEHAGHPSVVIARVRDVKGQFLRNVRELTAGNVRAVQAHSREFLASWDRPVKFAHVDASHNYASVRGEIEGLKRWVVPGGVLCGDDFETAHRPIVVRSRACLRVGFASYHPRGFRVESVYEQPLGGSESGLCYLTEVLARAGHEVFLLNAVTEPEFSRGVQCLPLTPAVLEQLPVLDAFVVQNMAGQGQALRARLGRKTRLVLWTGHAHDQPGVQALAEAAERNAYDGFALVSQWQRGQFVRQFGLDPRRVAVLCNGIAPAFENLFPRALHSPPPGLSPSPPAPLPGGARGEEEAIVAAKARPPVLVYTSTPYRGLDVLLEAFPRVRRAVPGAVLKVFSSMKVYGLGDGEDRERFGRLYEQCRATAGVEHARSVPQPRLAGELRAAAVLAYPNTFPETSCIAVLEAMAAGCRVVTSERGALPETTAGFATLIPDGVGREEYVERFVAETVAALGGLESAEDQLRRQVEHVNRRCTWARLAGEWVRWLS
jgi:glycosyltransferase involved in cell wall biosynthesis